MKSGLTGMTTGILGGISGIVSQPVRGAKDDGASGFMKGLGKGVVGAFTKPASGVMDFGLDTMSALRDSTRGPKCSATVMRLQRHIPPGGIIVPYSEHSAKGQRLFYSYQALTPRDTDQIDEGITEHYYAHSKLKNGHYLLITTQRILELEAQQGEGDSDSGCELQLQLHTSATVRGVCHVEIVRTGDEIMLHLRVERSQFRTAVSTPNTAASRNMSWTSSFKVPKPRSLAIEEGIVHCNAAALTHKGAVEMRDNIMAVVTLYQHELKVKRFED
ncbi:hypothetical protein SARC_04566 [Sphaeroforma arctica JP610]|uniref:Intermembrane lipid transfer protein VPS13-like C-terminal domain-containing protein n=1 Tax=Sphaeroforma arctica JP610 TaxID=667725 RepID=A0A0L0G263_9EUKA|nr:hypothetical protein SARC_04566 [Sphaeroforma arctica JP610]KNC83160.1 hypothetical protein SARC_04566 [Sphaeroforma arctica JP610]|eukprot:XP_014157062.1 hypothetical protein SARC_04566 [Sphaeroforma arctica JP610]